MARRRTLADVLARLDAAYDYRSWHWQPETPSDEIGIGAVLVQHTSWSNVELALDRLRAADALTLSALADLDEDALAALVHPAGTPNTKARRLLALAQLARDHGGIDALLGLPQNDLRDALLSTHGVGPETADAIALYAAGRATFVVDAYARRIFGRLGLGPAGDSYATWQAWFESALLPDAETYRRYHALLVLHGKTTCRPRPRCDGCCLLSVCETGRSEVGRSRAAC